MDDKQKKTIFAFPAVQEQDEFQTLIHSLSPLLRLYGAEERLQIDGIFQRINERLQHYGLVRHLTPMDFLLVSLVIELIMEISKLHPEKHPPFP
jgi:hypothetical protein